MRSIAPLKHPEHDLLTFSVKVSRDGFHPYISETVLLIVTKETPSDTKFYLINYYSVAYLENHQIFVMEFFGNIVNS